MKTLVFTIKTPAEGDLIIVEYSSTRGGCTHVKHQVIGAHQRAQADEKGVVTKLENVPAETPRDIAAILAGKIKTDWMPEAFEAKVNEQSGNLIVNCTGLVQDVMFRASVAGDGGTAVEMMEL